LKARRSLYSSKILVTKSRQIYLGIFQRRDMLFLPVAGLVPTWSQGPAPSSQPAMPGQGVHPPQEVRGRRQPRGASGASWRRRRHGAVRGALPEEEAQELHEVEEQLVVPQPARDHPSAAPGAGPGGRGGGAQALEAGRLLQRRLAFEKSRNIGRPNSDGVTRLI